MEIWKFVQQRVMSGKKGHVVPGVVEFVDRTCHLWTFLRIFRSRLTSSDLVPAKKTLPHGCLPRFHYRCHSLCSSLLVWMRLLILSKYGFGFYFDCVWPSVWDFCPCIPCWVKPIGSPFTIDVKLILAELNLKIVYIVQVVCKLLKWWLKLMCKSY